MVALRASPPMGVPQPQGSTYPEESLVCKMVKATGLLAGGRIAVAAGTVAGRGMAGVFVREHPVSKSKLAIARLI